MLKRQIQDDATKALKSGDHLTADTLRMVLAFFIVKEKDKRYKILKLKPESKEEDLASESFLTDEEATDVIFSEIKKRKDAILLYEKGSRPELAEKEKKEIEILKKYLPEQISKEELKKMVEDSINKIGATGMKDMGKVMADLALGIKGKADSGEVSKIVKEFLLDKN